MTKPIDPLRRTRRTREARTLSIDPVPEASPTHTGAGRSDRIKPPPEAPLADRRGRPAQEVRSEGAHQDLTRRRVNSADRTGLPGLTAIQR